MVVSKDLEYSERFKYSEQAKLLLNEMPNFNKKEFEKWFEDNLSIGSNSIMQYLTVKNVEVRKNGVKLK